MQYTLARKLRVLRAERGLTLREAEELTGVDKDTLSKIERGLRRPYDVTLSKLAKGYGVPVEELLEADSPQDPQQWKSVLASVRRRQREVEAKVGELIALPDHSKDDLYQVKWALDEAQECVDTLMLALPGSHRRHRRGRDMIAIDNLFAVDPDQWEELGNTERFYDGIVERLVEAGLVELKERAGQKAEPVPVGIG
jgi:transcriptional regulator with XRE-family HTH domain